MIVVGPGIPPEMRDFCFQVALKLAELETPQAPTALWTHDEAATLEATAPAAEHPGKVCRVEDINSIVHSTLVASTWTWRRADGTAL